MYQIKKLYHQIMIWYCGWKTRRLVKQMRKLGKQYNLPSLDAYTDQQIIKGSQMYHNYPNN